ncbi:MAG TPA: hypothetical protein ENJ79_00850 [Gammaproteobacteria bacterium]|nr:hypothetical protein [Gammaproteobacteria bacterium]
MIDLDNLFPAVAGVAGLAVTGGLDMFRRHMLAFHAGSRVVTVLAAPGGAVEYPPDMTGIAVGGAVFAIQRETGIEMVEFLIGRLGTGSEQQKRECKQQPSEPGKLRLPGGRFAENHVLLVITVSVHR